MQITSPHCVQVIDEPTPELRAGQVRVRLRCKLTGRPRGNYRKFELSRIMLRELGNQGQVPGMVKASW